MEKHQKTTVSLIFYLCKIQEENVPSLTQNEIFLYIICSHRITASCNVKKQYAILHGKMSRKLFECPFFRPTTVLC